MATLDTAHQDGGGLGAKSIPSMIPPMPSPLRPHRDTKPRHAISSIHKRRRSQRGFGSMVLVEFVIGVPLLLFLVFGIIYYSWLGNTKLNINAIAYEAVRFGAVLPGLEFGTTTFTNFSSFQGEDKNGTANNNIADWPLHEQIHRRIQQLQESMLIPRKATVEVNGQPVTTEEQLFERIETRVSLLPSNPNLISVEIILHNVRPPAQVLSTSFGTMEEKKTLRTTRTSAYMAKPRDT